LSLKKDFNGNEKEKLLRNAIPLLWLNPLLDMLTPQNMPPIQKQWQYLVNMPFYQILDGHEMDKDDPKPPAKS